jgi:cytochrome b
MAAAAMRGRRLPAAAMAGCGRAGSGRAMEQTVPVKVWDGWVRLFHWGTAACVLVSYVSAQREAWDVHYLSGYTLLTLVLFRIGWGVVGSRNARFATFIRSPLAGLRELAKFARPDADVAITHNPAGAWMVVLMLALLLAQAVTGLFTNHDVGFTYSQHGPLANWVNEETSERMSGLHLVIVDLLLLAILVHVLAAVAYQVLKGHDLIRPMVTGVKRLPASVGGAPRHGSAVLALALLAAAAALVWLVTRLGGG